MKRYWKSFALGTLAIASSFFSIGGLAKAEVAGEDAMYYIDRELNPAAVIQDAVIAGTYNADFPKPEPNFLAKELAAAANRFENDWGNLPQIKLEAGSTLKTGASGPRVAALRRRLGLTASDQFDQDLANKISRYRAAHDLPAGSIADKVLIASLNRGHGSYAKIIGKNLNRMMELPSDLGERFVLVDAAAQMLYMYEGNQVVGSMKVIVGKPDDPTPILAGYIRHSVVNPYWNVPPDLVRDRYAPRVLKQGKSYLTTRGFEALSSWDDDAKVLNYSAVDWQAVTRGEYKLRFRQRPGPGNGMGQIKFMFPNRFGVYLHDTPSRALFNKTQRTLSAGCVRVEKAWQLANWLYGFKPSSAGKEPEQIVALNRKTPVYITYFTAVTSADGFDFRKDVYNRDLKETAVNRF